MIERIEQTAAAIATTTGIRALDPRILAVMGEVRRHEFVPQEWAGRAYKPQPLPIGHGQTISQPFIVALMTELLELKNADKVLEVGTGSAYQAAILSRLAGEVFTIEIIPEIGETARATLDRLGHTNVHTRIGDGYLGWPERAPFDAIIVTAAPDHIPQALIDQLEIGGRMVIPVGEFTQDLMVLTKQPSGTTINRRIVPVQFVPLVRE